MSAKITTIVAVAAFALLAGVSSIASISPGEKGVIVTAGQVVGTAEPGFFFKTPFLTNVAVINTREQLKAFPDLQAYTKDQQVASISSVSVTYRVDPASVEDIYLRYGSSDAMVDQLLNRPVSALLEQTFGQYNAERAVQDRTALGKDFSDRLKTSVEGSPLIITAVNVENFSFPPEYEANINARMAAEVEAGRAAQTAKKTLIDAQAQADSQLAIATANAKAVTLQGEAEANAIRAKGAALRDNPSLVSLTAAERWDGVLPTQMVPGGATPFVNVGQ